MEIIRNVCRKLGSAKKRHYAIGDSRSVGEIKRRFLKEHFNIDSIIYRIDTEIRNGLVSLSGNPYKNFPKTIERISDLTDRNSLFSTRILFIIEHSNNVKSNLNNKKFLLGIKSKSANISWKNDHSSVILFPSIEWTQLIYSGLKGLYERNPKALNLDICEHINLPPEQYERIRWSYMGNPFWDYFKTHLSTGKINSKFYFQFCLINILNEDMSVNISDRQYKEYMEFAFPEYKHQWVSVEELIEFQKNAPNNYNYRTIRQFISEIS